MSQCESYLLPLLEKVRKAPARGSAGIVAAWRAACPVCDAHGLPLSIGLKSDGGVVGYCFGGHGLPDVLEALGLEWSDILPEMPTPLGQLGHAIKGNGGPNAWAGLMSAIDALLNASMRAVAANDDLAVRMAEDLRMYELRGVINDMARRVVKSHGGSHE